MKIRKDVEQAVRAALTGAVAGEEDRFKDAVMNIGKAGDEFSGKALDLVFRITSVALFSIHEAQRPTDARLQVMAHDFATEEEADWAHVDESTALAYLTAIADARTPLEVIPLADAMFASFAVGGWLLSAFIPEDSQVHWNNFLDAILTRLESEATE